MNCINISSVQSLDQNIGKTLICSVFNVFKSAGSLDSFIFRFDVWSLIISKIKTDRRRGFRRNKITTQVWTFHRVGRTGGVKYPDDPGILKSTFEGNKNIRLVVSVLLWWYLVVMELFKCKHNNLENLAQGETGRDITTSINISLCERRLSQTWYLCYIIYIIFIARKRSRSLPAGINTCMITLRGGWRISHRLPGTLQILICRDFS